MSFLKVIILAVVQGLAELLPVSSSAHVVVAEKLLGLNPSDPPLTLLLVMLHTGTMFAVIVYFWQRWRCTYFSSVDAFKMIALRVIVATVLTGVVGAAIIKLVEATILRDVPHAQIEDLFGRLEIIAPALAVAGILIFIAGILERRRLARAKSDPHELSVKAAGLIGVVQGLCLPFRGFSRSGATISTGMLLGVDKATAEAFSFALAVVITPPVVAREAMRFAVSVGRERAAAAAVDNTLNDLLDVPRLNRVVQQGAFDPRQLSLPELLTQTVNTAFFPGKETSSPRVGALRRGVQGRLLARLAAVTEDPSLSVAAAVDVKTALTDLATRLAAIKKGDNEDVATAHFYATAINGDKLKDFAAKYLAAYPVAPTGPPIGAEFEDDWFGDVVR